MQATDNKAATKKRTVAGQQGTACSNNCPIDNKKLKEKNTNITSISRIRTVPIVQLQSINN